MTRVSQSKTLWAVASTDGYVWCVGETQKIATDRFMILRSRDYKDSWEDMRKEGFRLVKGTWTENEK